MNGKTWGRALATGVFLVSIGAVPASAYRMIQNTTVGTVTAGIPVTCNDPGGFAHPTHSNIYWYLNPAGQGYGKGAVIQSALDSWTNVANADHTLIYVGTTSTGWATDGRNTVVWASGNGCTGSCLALTALTLQSGQDIVEADVTFNSAVTWQTNGTNYDIQAVAAHEFGHTLGIHHTDLTSTPQPTMYTPYFGSAGRTLEIDDQQALQCLQNRYPPAAGGAQNQRPRAAFNWTPDCDTVHFDASGSFDPDGSIATYTWDFGDGTGTITTSPWVSHWYGYGRTLDVTLWVTDDNGLDGDYSYTHLNVGTFLFCE